MAIEPNKFEEFEARAAGTDLLGPAMDTPLLGLVGEVGSLVSALKKKRRDTDGFFGYHEVVTEEFGDALWYMSAVARRGGVSLAEIAVAADSGAVPPASSSIEEFELALLRLASDVGALAKAFVQGLYRDDATRLRHDLTQLIHSLILAASASDVDVKDAAAQNILKNEDRWPRDKILPAPLDDGLHIDEQLPRAMRVLIYEREINGVQYVFQKCGGMLLGDRLTDNHSPPDDYRFHDVFHYAFAAVLSWSPTTRALLKVKRKSQRILDENEDGARANLIEEGLSTWIFEIAKQHRFFANTPTLGLDLLKDVKRFVRGYEAEHIPMWLWEKAILQGYQVFRRLRDVRRGVVCTDLGRREIWYEDMTTDDLRQCGLIAEPG